MKGHYEFESFSPITNILWGEQLLCKYTKDVSAKNTFFAMSMNLSEHGCVKRHVGWLCQEGNCSLSMALPSCLELRRFHKGDRRTVGTFVTRCIPTLAVTLRRLRRKSELLEKRAASSLSESESPLTSWLCCAVESTLDHSGVSSSLSCISICSTSLHELNDTLRCDNNSTLGGIRSSLPKSSIRACSMKLVSMMVTPECVQNTYLG